MAENQGVTSCNESCPGALLRRIENGRVVDGTGATPIEDGCVDIHGERLTYVGPRAAAPALPPQAQRLDARGGTILPGLVEAHFHATYFNVAELADLDVKYPVEYVTLLAAANAKLALECGYTSARSCGSLHNVDVWLKQAIENGVCPGPRLAPSGREICGAGGLMDWNPDHLRLGMEGLILLVNGPVEARAAVRSLVKNGVEWIKTYPSGDAASPRADAHADCMTVEELQAVVAEAHNYKAKVTGHARSTSSIKNALRAGFDALEHATFIDDEGLELLLARDVPVVPALHFEHASIEHGRAFGLSTRCIDAHKETLEGGLDSVRRILKAGGRVGLGGDFGFAWNPHGTYAKEITFFVRAAGVPPLQAITCATKTGAEILGRAKDLGTLEAGKLADVLVVDGDVLADVSILEDRRRFVAVLQGGAFVSGGPRRP
jgi:imidazolonepropionase-like amidohydrolase